MRFTLPDTLLLRKVPRGYAPVPPHLPGQGVRTTTAPPQPPLRLLVLPGMVPVVAADPPLGAQATGVAEAVRPKKPRYTLGLAAAGALTILLYVAVTAGVIEYFFRDFRAFGAAAIEMPAWSLPVLTLCIVATLPFQALRWRGVIEPIIATRIHLPALGLMGILSAGMVFNIVLPGTGGEIASAYMLRRLHGVPLSAALAALIYSRIVAFITLGCLGLAVFPLFSTAGLPDAARLILFAGITAVGVITLGLIAISVWPQILQGAAALGLRALGKVWRRPDPAHFASAKGHIEDLGNTGWWCRQVLRKGWRPFLPAVVHSLGILACHLTTLWLAAWSTGHLPNLEGIILLHTLSSFAMVAAIVVPGGFGAWEVTFIATTISVLRVPSTEAAVLFVAVRVAFFCYFIASIAIGWLAWRSLQARGVRAEELEGIHAELRREVTKLQLSSGASESSAGLPG